MKSTTQQDMKLVMTTGLKLWETRRKGQGLKTGVKRTTELQLEFLLGAIGIMDSIRDNGESCVSPSIYFSAIRGEYIEAEQEPEAKTVTKSEPIIGVTVNSDKPRFL